MSINKLQCCVRGKLEFWQFGVLQPIPGRVSSRKHDQQWEVELSVTIPLKKPDHHGAWEMSGNMEEAPGTRFNTVDEVK